MLSSTYKVVDRESDGMLGGGSGTKILHGRIREHLIVNVLTDFFGCINLYFSEMRRSFCLLCFVFDQVFPGTLPTPPQRRHSARYFAFSRNYSTYH